MVPEIWSAKDKIYCHFGLFFFLPFDPPNNPKSEKFEKIKKMAEDIIILHLCTTNDTHEVWFLIYQA